MSFVPDGAVRNTVTSGTTCAVSLTTAQTNEIICVLTHGDSAPVSVSGSTLGAFTQIGTTGTIPDQMVVWAAFASGTLSGETITATYLSGLSRLVVDAFGVPETNQTSLTGAFDAGGPVGGSYPVSMTTVNANTMVIAYCELIFGVNDSGGPGFTLINGNNPVLVEYQVLSAPGTVSGTNSNGFGGTELIFAIVKAAAAAPAGVGGSAPLFASKLGPKFSKLKPRLAFTSSGNTFSDSVTETGIAVDTPSASAIFASSDTEAGTATDTSTGAWVTSSAITEAGSATDSESATASFAPSITESGSASDSEVVTAVFVASEAEAGSASDSPSSSAIFVVSDTEAASAADSESSTGATISDGVIEAATAAETETAQVVFAPSISEAGTAADASSNTAVYSASASEAGTAIDAEDANGVFVVSDTEAASAADFSNGVIPGPPSTDGPHSNPFFATPGPMTSLP